MSDNVTLWQIIKNITLDRDTILWIAGAAISIATAIGVFAGPILAHIRQERNKKQKDKLKAHFEEIRNEAQNNISPLVSSLTERNGEIYVINKHGHQGSNLELPKLSESFQAHFSSEATKLAEYNQRIQKHNNKCNELYLNIKSVFKSKGLDIVSATMRSKLQSPCIFDNIFTPIFKWWQQRHCGEKPWYDFEKIETKPDSGNNLYVSGWESDAIAFGETDSDKEVCRQVILIVAENKEFESESVKITELAKEIVQEINNFKQHLTESLNDLKNYNLKIKGYEFKREDKKCPRCSQIFD